MVKPITPILQARMGSTRLPGKVLKSISGSTVLEHIIRRVRRAALEPMILATSVNAADDAIEAECARLGVRCFRGSENDVLSRFYKAAKRYGAAHIMRICADNPLIDPEILDALAAFYCENDYSYVTNSGVPLGLGAEIFTYERLEDAFLHGDQPYHREHVTPYLYESQVGCGMLHMNAGAGLRFTLDTPEDLAFVTAVYNSLYEKSPTFGLDEVLALLRARPELVELNKDVRQKRYNEV